MNIVQIGFTKSPLFYYYLFMYEQKSLNTGYFELFGIKVFEIIRNNIDVFEREFTSDNDEQPLLQSYSTAVYKIFGIPFIKFGANYSSDT